MVGFALLAVSFTPCPLHEFLAHKKYVVNNCHTKKARASCNGGNASGWGALACGRKVGNQRLPRRSSRTLNEHFGSDSLPANRGIAIARLPCAKGWRLTPGQHHSWRSALPPAFSATCRRPIQTRMQRRPPISAFRMFRPWAGADSQGSTDTRPAIRARGLGHATALGGALRPVVRRRSCRGKYPIGLGLVRQRIA